MSKKLFFLAPMLVAAALFAPTAAQALQPHYFVNAVELGNGVKEDAIGWGTITLTTNAKPAGNFLECHNVAGGYVEGVAAASKGKGATEQFAVYNCKQEKQCNTATDAVVVSDLTPLGAPSLPWPSELRDAEGKIRSFNTGVAVVISCIFTEGAEKGKVDGTAAPFITNQIPGSKCEAQAPAIIAGTSALHPGFSEFGGAGTKELEIPSPEFPKCTLVGKTEGEVKTLGYLEQDLINVKDS